MPVYTVTYVENPAAMREFTSWRGPIGKDLNRRAKTLEYRAKTSVGVATGALQRSITTRKVAGNDYLEARVGSWTKRYAMLHHEGTKPHLIMPRKKGGVLRFRVRGRVVFAKSVRHPGTRPNRYLARWLREAAR